MIQRLLLLCALVALASESAYAVELGKLQLHSALNQRLNADIPLTNVSGLGTDEILPGLASAAEFDRMGIDRPYELTNLRFTVQQGQNGQMFVHITSSKPIVEPYLDFLMEVLWPNGRIVREYTILLDPPVFGKSGVQQLSAPSSQPAPTKPASRPTAPAPSTAGPAATSPAGQQTMTARMEEGSMSNGQYGVTGPGDTLWKIAMKVRPSRDVSVQQTMLAIKRANPDAFINDNINLLKAGRVLRIPAMQDIQRESFASAVQEVKAQNEAFQAYKSGAPMPQLNASRRKSGSGSGTAGGNSGELRLLTAHNAAEKSGTAAGGGDNSAQEQALQDQLAASREDLDKAKRANTDLNGRVNDLQDQIKTLNNLVKLKDDQLAALRAAVQKMQKEQQANPAAAPVTTPRTQGSLLTNPFVLIGLGLILVAGVAGGLIFMRRRNEAEEYESDDFSEEEASAHVDAEGEEEETDQVLALDEEDEELSPQTSDVISEAEIYIAYGRFPQAITFLQNAIEAEPERADIQLKLLEVYAQTEDASAFEQQFEQLVALGDENAIAQARALQSTLPGALDFEMEESGSPAAGSPAAAQATDEDELSFDLDDLGAETEESTLGLEEDLDLDLDIEEESDEPALSLEDTDLDLDLAADSSEDDLDSLEATVAESDEDEDGAITLDEADLEGADLDLELAEAAGDEEDDDAIELDMEEDVDLGGELDLKEDEALDLDTEVALDDQDEEVELNLDEDEESLDLSEADDALDLDVEGLDLDDDGDFELNLDEDASTKLDLARAYIDMGDSDGARNVLQEVIEEGSAAEIQEANELLAKID